MANFILASDGLNANVTTTNIRFRSETEVGIFVQNLVEKTLMMMATSLDGNTVDILKENMVHLLESDQGAELTSNLDKLTGMIAKNIADAFDNLRNGICPEVESLQQEVIKLAHEYIAAGTGIDCLTESLKGPDNTFKLLDWSITEVEGPITDIIGALHKKCNLGGDVSSINVNYIMRKFGGVENIAIPEDGKAKIIGQLESKMGSSISVETATLVLNLVSSSDACNSYINHRFPTNALSTLSASCVVNAYEIMVEIYPFIKALKQIDPSLIEADKAKWDSNISNMMYLMYSLIYLLHAARVKKMHDVLILDATCLNKDQFNVFESRGGTTSDIANFIRVYYNQNPNDIVNLTKRTMNIPAPGVKTEEVLNAKAKVTDVITRAEVSVKGSLMIIKDAAFKNAYAFIMKNYVKDFVKSLTDAGNTQELAKYMFSQIAATESLISKKDGSVEDAIYEFFFRTKHKGTTSEVVYRKLGVEYVKMVSEKGYVLDDDINMADAFVMADITAEFLVNMMEVTSN